MSAARSPFSKDEEFRMFALNMAINSKPLHFSKDDQKLADLVLNDARQYYAFLTEGVEPPRPPAVVV